jgi:hypothetical protein
MPSSPDELVFQVDADERCELVIRIDISRGNSEFYADLQKGAEAVADLGIIVLIVISEGEEDAGLRHSGVEALGGHELVLGERGECRCLARKRDKQREDKRDDFPHLHCLRVL